MKQRTLMAGALVAVFVVILWWFLVFSGLKSQSSDAASELDTANQQKQSLTSELASLEALQANAAQIDADLAALNQRPAPTPDLATFVREADRIGTETGVKWVSVSPAEPVQTGSVATTSMTIEVEGEYFSVLHYLQALEGLSRLVVVDGIVLTGGASGTSTGAPGAETPAPDGPPVLSAALTARMFSLSAVSTAPVAATTDTTVAAPTAETPTNGGG